MHTLLETALNNTSDEDWMGVGVAEPKELELSMEIRKEMPIGDHIISGKYDVMFRYKGSQWQLGDLKTMSVWGIMIDKNGKFEEWTKQLSIYRYLNQDKDISDEGIILTVYTDWSKSDSVIKAKQGYPQSRIGVEHVKLWSLDKTKNYLEAQESRIVDGIKKLADTGSIPYRCSESELWKRGGKWAYYSKKDSKRATKVIDTEQEAEALMLKAKDSTAYIEYRKPEAVRCKYCSVVQFCDQYAEMLVTGEVKP